MERAKSTMYNGKSRHIRRRHNSIRQLLSTGVISIDYVASKDNIADPFTKGLSRELVSKSSKGMGNLVDWRSQDLGKYVRSGCTTALDVVPWETDGESVLREACLTRASFHDLLLFSYLSFIVSVFCFYPIRMPRGGVEQENYGLLCSKVADLVLPNISDRWCWSLKGSQEFSVKSSRILIDNTILPKAEVPTRWLRVVPIKVNVHAWRVCLDKLPTRANLSLRGMDIPSIACPLCNSAVESTSHIFFACPLARQVWRNFLIWYLLRDVVVNLALQKSIALWDFSTKACSLIR
ncbi:RNA-directed DNA polymerase, eukaryota [Tanacetum coccineum]